MLEKTLEQNLRARNVAIVTKSGEKLLEFFLFWLCYPK